MPSSALYNNRSRGDFMDPNSTIARIILFPCLADKLPSALYGVVTNGKIAAAVVLGVYLGFLGFVLPVWLLSMVISEWGVYLTMVGGVFLIGRGIIRMIAFPGASRKVMSDIEGEFAKYTIRMIESASSSIIDLATVLFAEDVNSSTVHQLPGLWKRVQSFRNRVLGVLLEVLVYMQNNTTNSLELSAEPAVGGVNFSSFGNNPLAGDVGCLAALPTKARVDGGELITKLQRVLFLLEELVKHAAPVLNLETNKVAENTRHIAVELHSATVDLRDFSFSLRNPTTENGEEDDREDPTDQMRRRLDPQNQNAIAQAKTAIGSILPMIDPLPNESIFGLDLLRGTVISRYQGARQLWVQRPQGGMLDLLHIPPPPNMRGEQCRAVMYCNPNAGLIETVGGMSYSAGNVPSADSQMKKDSWIDFYTSLGFDVYVFNYAGYGRSYGTTACVRGSPNRGDHSQGCFARIVRILKSSLLAFQPTPETLRADGATVAQFVINHENVHQLVIHGESIGGMAAAGAARFISQVPLFRDKLSLLICDRTFCNLEAIAQRLVGGWSGYAIRALAPFWSTDIAGDFLGSTCAKVLASDAADVIISEASSLKSGVALWKELRRGSSTKDIGWIPDTPLQYRMADFENCCVNDTRYAPSNSLFRAQPPVWPKDKLISVEEAFHFAACCTRIAKAAKAASVAAKQDAADSFATSMDGPPNIVIVNSWIALACCDGLTGSTLGVAVKRGFDASVAWLCSAAVFGGQVVAENTQNRTSGGSTDSFVVSAQDFDLRPDGYEVQEQESSIVYPKPIPEVLQATLSFLELGDATVASLSHEFQYVAGVLLYIQSRLSDTMTLQASIKTRYMHNDASVVGSFLNLNCGHNNPFSQEERNKLQERVLLALQVQEAHPGIL